MQCDHLSYIPLRYSMPHVSAICILLTTVTFLYNVQYLPVIPPHNSDFLINTVT